MEKKYFKVIAKSGHVGKGMCYYNVLPIVATSAKEAAKIARRHPRVKHDHPDAIYSVEEISFAEFRELQIDYENNPYNSCKSRQDQRRLCSDIYKDICEDEYITRDKSRYNNRHTDDNIKYKKRKESLYVNADRKELRDTLLNY